MIAAYTHPVPPGPFEPCAGPPLTEAELLGLMHKHCQKSWQATRWMLEMLFPQKYGKRKASAGVSDIEALFNALSSVLKEEIADDVLRARIAARLDRLAAEPLASQVQPAVAPEEINDSRSAADREFGDDGPEPDANPQPSHDLEPAAAVNAEPSAVDQRPAPDAPPQQEPFGQPPASSLLQAPLPANAIDRSRRPPSWMEQARQQNEERKRLRKLRDGERPKQRKQRAQAGHVKKRRR